MHSRRRHSAPPHTSSLRRHSLHLRCRASSSPPPESAPPRRLPLQHQGVTPPPAMCRAVVTASRRVVDTRRRRTSTGPPPHESATVDQVSQTAPSYDCLEWWPAARSPHADALALARCRPTHSNERLSRSSGLPALQMARLLDAHARHLERDVRGPARHGADVWTPVVVRRRGVSRKP